MVCASWFDFEFTYANDFILIPSIFFLVNYGTHFQFVSQYHLTNLIGITMLTFITIISKIYTCIVDSNWKTIIIMHPWIHQTINWIRKIHKHKCYRCYNHVHTQLCCKFSLQVLFPYSNSTWKLDVVSEATCISIAIRSIANPQNLFSTCSDYNAWMQVVQTSILTKIKAMQALILTTFQIFACLVKWHR